MLSLSSCSAHQSSNTSLTVGPELSKFLANSKKPAVIKFYADWCGSCKEFQPVFKKVSASMASQVDFYEVDIDKKSSKALIKELKVSRIPELIFVNKERTSLSRQLGVMSESKLSTKINLLRTP